MGGVIAILSFMVYTKYFLGPAFEKARLLGAEAKTLQQNLKAAKTALSGFSQFEKEVTRLREKTKELAIRFPSKTELPELLEHLSEIADKSGVQIVEISPSRMIQTAEKEKVSSTLYEEIPIALTAKSGYHELGAFINQLENSERIFTVKNVEIKADPSDSKRHHVALVVETFVREKESP